MEKNLPLPLKHLVSWSVAILGNAIKEEYGEDLYLKIDKVRLKMKKMRGMGPSSWKKSTSMLLEEYNEFEKLAPKGKMATAHSFSSMLELINRCESAYRDFRLSTKEIGLGKKKPEVIAFVLTAHPTEARSPECLTIFRLIQDLLIKSLKEGKKNQEAELFHLLKLALKIPMARETAPSVLDEAGHIFNYVLKDEILSLLIKFRQDNLPVMLRSWVGGDKDGHPGVNEKTMIETLTLSRKYLLDFILARLEKIECEISLFHEKTLLELISNTKVELNSLRKLGEGDGEKVKKFIEELDIFAHHYESVLRIESNPLNEIYYLIKLFPALVLPLEIREDSAVVKEALNNPEKFPIGKMLINLGKISKGGKAKQYIRGFVLSMVESVDDLQNGIFLAEKTLGKLDLPVVPLFETEKALLNSSKILNSIFSQQKKLIPLHQKNWDSRYEVMLGYSDSSKEGGVFPSRFLISKAMIQIDKTIKKNKLIPVFFHGSGGSVERGGGSIKEQTAWWPKSSLNIFKATIQGEMVARSFATANIFQSQIYTIAAQLKVPRLIEKKQNILEIFSLKIKGHYQKIVEDSSFLSVVEKASPYSYLNELKIGSRPSSRSKGLNVKGLRAIPWILCWTQTRVLFPTWWGVGSSWEELNPKQKKELIKAYKSSALLGSYIKVLSFTLAKVDLSIWRLYLEKSGLKKELIEKTFDEFYLEFIKTLKFTHKISGKRSLLWYRPWLGTSINYRSSMIHPLNILQLHALKSGDNTLLRETITGVACGMLTTG